MLISTDISSNSFATKVATTWGLILTAPVSYHVVVVELCASSYQVIVSVYTIDSDPLLAIVVLLAKL